MDVNKPASWSAQDLRTRPVIPSGPAAFLTFTLFSSLRTSSFDTVITWSSLLVCCFLTRWSAESHCRHYIQSGRRRCLALRPATDLLSPLRRSYFQRNRWSSVPATCVESHWDWKCDSILSLYRSLAALTALGEHSTMLCTRSCFLTKYRQLCGSAIVNRITDCSVHSRFWLKNVLIVTVHGLLG